MAKERIERTSMIKTLLGTFGSKFVRILVLLGLLTGGSAVIGPQNLPAPLSTIAEKVRSVVPIGGGDGTGILGSLKAPFGGGGSSGSTSYPPVSVENITRLLDSLSVKGKAPMTGYDRLKEFGQPWTDNNGVQLGHNGCKTREDILARDMTDVKSKGCTVKTGVLQDPYTGKKIEFTRGPKTSMAVQIDHIVALGNAWVTGAQLLNQTTRVNLANDPLNLLAVDGPANNNKRDGDAATWLPPNKGFRCQYVSRQVQVKAKYHLWVTPAEKEAIQRVLSKC